MIPYLCLHTLLNVTAKANISSKSYLSQVKGDESVFLGIPAAHFWDDTIDTSVEFQPAAFLCFGSFGCY